MRLWPGGDVFQRPTTLCEDIPRRGLARRCHSIMLRTTVAGAAAEESMSANHGSIALVMKGLIVQYSCNGRHVHYDCEVNRFLTFSLESRT